MLNIISAYLDVGESFPEGFFLDPRVLLGFFGLLPAGDREPHQVAQASRGRHQEIAAFPREQPIPIRIDVRAPNHEIRLESVVILGQELRITRNLDRELPRRGQTHRQEGLGRLPGRSCRVLRFLGVRVRGRGRVRVRVSE